MRWKAITLRLGVGFALHQALRSGRWTEREKVAAVFAASQPVFFAWVAIQGWWILTGRGRLRRLLGLHVAVAQPWPQGPPFDVAKGLRELRERPFRA